jgi:hydroxyethylthiazole kinase-like uncharacterized protein yjeF
MSAQAIDARWRAAHPLPEIGDGMDKEERGRALVVGGSAFVPGALLLTGEALLRAGAGKVQLATIASVAVPLGVSFPEAAVIGLPADDEGEIAGEALALLKNRLSKCGALVLGPGMTARPQTATLVEGLIAAAGSTQVLIDAGAMTALAERPAALKGVVLTPHHGELATLTGGDKEQIARDPAGAAVEAAARFGAVVVLKGSETLIAAGTTLLRYDSGAPGLGTAGSGDVLAGIIGGLLARGMAPIAAAGWGVWLHGEAGKAAAVEIGPIGFLARDLLPHIPGLMAPD